MKNDRWIEMRNQEYIGKLLSNIEQLKESLQKIKDEAEQTEDAGGFVLWVQEKLKDNPFLKDQ